LRAGLVVTGDEVLAGRVGERNARYLAADLDARGVVVERVVTVGDDRPAITDAVRGLLAGAPDLVVTTGGLGVTHDDVTMEAVAEAVGVPLVLDEDALARVRAAVARWPVDDLIGPEVRDRTERKQAMLPRGAEVVPPAGTAPGAALRSGPTLVVVMPGPPGEVTRMWAEATAGGPLADLLARAAPPPRRVVRIHGIIEAQLVERLDGEGDDALAGVRAGICARAGELEVVLTETGARPGAADALVERLRTWFGADVFAEGGEGLDEVVARLLTDRGETVAVAESCTGGMLGARLTARPGSSAYVLGGVIAYADRVKRELLGVPAATLAAHGAVSAPAARAMAEGARARTGASWALAITGIAGPGGGGPGKPVGLVFIACAGPDGTEVTRHVFRGDRDGVRERSVTHALHLLRRRLTGEPAGPRG